MEAVSVRVMLLKLCELLVLHFGFRSIDGAGGEPQVRGTRIQSVIHLPEKGKVHSEQKER